MIWVFPFLQVTCFCFLCIFFLFVFFFSVPRMDSAQPSVAASLPRGEELPGPSVPHLAAGNCPTTITNMVSILLQNNVVKRTLIKHIQKWILISNTYPLNCRAIWKGLSHFCILFINYSFNLGEWSRPPKGLQVVQRRTTGPLLWMSTPLSVT